MNDDFNTALTIGHIFNLLKKVNGFDTGQVEITKIDKDTFDRMKSTILGFTHDVLGLKNDISIDPLPILDDVLKAYAVAKERKDYDRVDQIRASLRQQGIVVKDMKGKISWALEE